MRLPIRATLRSIGLGVGAFMALNLLGEVVRAPFEALGDWVSLPSTPWLRYLVCASLGALLVANGVVRRLPRALRRVAVTVFAFVALLALGDTGAFFVALARGTIETPAVAPASLLVAALFAALALDRRSSAPAGVLRLVPTTLVVVPVLVALPLIRIATFGPTRYERRADCAIVFGARVWNDGTPSPALADRIDEGVRLYKRGLVQRIVMSGGVEPENSLSEARVMRGRAEAAGVPREAILLDEDGVDTASTVRNAAHLMTERGLASALIVSHYYHEPRAKLLFDRAGIRAYTVPARMTQRLLKEPYFIAREVPAYYVALAVD